MAYSPYKMKGHTLPGIKQVKSNKTKDGRAGSSAFQKKSDLDSIDNNRHAPARTKNTVDPADVKRREKKNTSKRVLTDKEARAEAVKNLYKPKSPARLLGEDRSKTKTKKSGKSKTVTIKDGKRSVVKRDAQGNVRKTKSGGVITKPQEGKTTTRKSQVKRGLKGVAKGALIAGGTAATMGTKGIMVPIAKGVMGVGSSAVGIEALNAAKRGEDKLRNRLKRKKKK